MSAFQNGFQEFSYPAISREEASVMYILQDCTLYTLPASWDHFLHWRQQAQTQTSVLEEQSKEALTLVYGCIMRGCKILWGIAVISCWKGTSLSLAGSQRRYEALPRWPYIPSRRNIYLPSYFGCNIGLLQQFILWNAVKAEFSHKSMQGMA